jgi:hypothetical protein
MALGPAVATGGVKGVSYGAATLTGDVNPRASDTSYYFQYGPTRAYGGQTPLANAGAGIRTVRVSAPISGLAPLTTYHFRLVAVNSAGASVGADRAFRTAKVPLSLQILASPNPVIFGAPMVIQGTLSGTGNGGRLVVLQANPFPYTQGFLNVGNPETTFADGSFSFSILSLTQATQFRVITTTNPPVISPVASEGVAVRVIAHIGRVRHHRHHRVRIYGTVTPALDGALVGIMRVTRGRDVLVSGTVLHHVGATHSSFSRVVRVKRGIYRVLVQVMTGALGSSYSAPLLVR